MKKILFIVGLAFAVYWFGFRGGGGCGSRGAVECPPAELEEGVGVTLEAGDACRGAGYLCYERKSFQVMRWPLDKGKLRIRVLVPEFLKGEDAQSVRDAAIEGFKEWDGRPFPLVIDTSRTSPKPDIAVTWVSSASEGGQAGHVFQRGMPDGKRLRYSVGDLKIMVPQVAGTTGVDGSVLAQSVGEMGPALVDRIRATAAHELGHALGLSHSDSPADIMYPQHRPRASPSARDFQTIDALYALPNGAMVR